jgi:predicted O-methyltransferase YrrM
MKRAFFAVMDRFHLHRLEHLDDPCGRRMAAVVSTLGVRDLVAEDQLVAAIEQQRRAWLESDDALVSGSLGGGREWDAGVTLRRACAASKDPVPASLLFLLVEEFRPRRVLELGTNVGVSSGYLAVALDRNRDRGSLYTLEASPYRMRYAKELHQSLGLNNIVYREGLFDDTLGSVLDDMEMVDMAFVDGHYRLEPTLRYFNRIKAHLAPHAVVVFDDIRISDEMRRAWREIQHDQRVTLAVDLYAIGVCVVGVAPRPAHRMVTPPISFALQHRELGVRDVLEQLTALVGGGVVR